jgi:hypothetical protein
MPNFDAFVRAPAPPHPECFRQVPDAIRVEGRALSDIVVNTRRYILAGTLDHDLLCWYDLAHANGQTLWSSQVKHALRDLRKHVVGQSCLDAVTRGQALNKERES